MLSEASLRTAQATELLAQICGPFQDRAAAHPELGIEVEWSETRGSVDFDIERHSDQPTVVWDNSGEPAQSPHEPRRKDLMRSFHRRARHPSSSE